MSAFARLANTLAEWPDVPPPSPSELTGVASRLAAVLHDLQTPEQPDPGPMDLAGLVSHLLRQTALREGGTPMLRVPRTPPWPDRSQWSRCRCAVTLERPGSFTLRPLPYYPPEAEGPDPIDPLEPALREDPRRASTAVRADPALTEVTAYTHYICDGQRMAVRSAMLLRPGGCLLVVLPTGSGKSLAVSAPALLCADEGGVTLVVVPTVALAMDQGRRAQEAFARHPQAGAVDTWAYHGGLSPGEAEGLRRRIREGTQPLVFASPEAVMRSLRPAVLDAAAGGMLRALVIDEAHLVAQWGQEFRPEFQALAGLRRTLLAACGQHPRPRTLLLTATLTHDVWQTLDTLFGDGRLEVCASVSLRAEPDFHVVAAADEQDRIERIGELVAVLPRPLILYTTRREDCEDWVARLREMGLRRVGSMHGRTTSAEREAVIRHWVERRLDVMVATSAFGLGMDQSDVRAVVHACLPETVDRYYQEVGRGGRDGRACLSFLVTTPGDLAVARALGKDRIVTVQTGLDRWRAMYGMGRPIGSDGAWLVPLDARRAAIQQDSDANVAWNLRTLVLMACAGLLTLEAHAPPRLERSPDETDAAFDERCHAEFAAYIESARVRPAPVGHLDEATWQAQVEPLRAANRQREARGFDRVVALTRREEAFSAIFAESYRIPEAGIEVGVGCASCPVTRQRGRAPHADVGPPPAALRDPVGDVDGRLLSLIPSPEYGSRLLVALPPEPPDLRGSKHSRRRLIRLMERLVTHGVREIVAHDDWLEHLDYRRLHCRARPPLVLHTSRDRAPEAWQPALPVARLSILWPHVERWDEPTWSADRPIDIVWLPADVRDPDRPDRAFFDTRSHLTLEELERRLD